MNSRMNWFKRKEKNPIDPLDIDWGIITADGDNDKEIIHVFNSDMTKKENGNLTKSLLLNKYRYYKKHLPIDRDQIFVFDLRGQDLSENEIEKIENDLINEIKKIDSKPKIKFKFEV